MIFVILSLVILVTLIGKINKIYDFRLFKFLFLLASLIVRVPTKRRNFVKEIIEDLPMMNKEEDKV